MSATDFQTFKGQTVGKTNNLRAPIKILRCKVTEAPKSVSGLVSIQAIHRQNANGLLDLGEAPWPHPNGKALPAVDDECIVGLDDTGAPTVLAWVTPDWGVTEQTKPALVSALPGSPKDGEEVYYQNATMATEGVVWMLRYRAASASEYKWELIGGPSLEVYSETVTTKKVPANTWTTMSSPKIAVPRAGLYIVTAVSQMQTLSTNIPVHTMGVSINGVAPVKQLQAQCNQPAISQFRQWLMFTGRAEVTKAGWELEQQYETNVEEEMSAAGRHISILPVRVI